MPFRQHPHQSYSHRPAGCSFGGCAPGVSGVMEDAGYLEPQPLSLLINLDQHNGQYVSWQITSLVAH